MAPSTSCSSCCGRQAHHNLKVNDFKFCSLEGNTETELSIRWGLLVQCSWANYAIKNRVEFLELLGGHQPDVQLIEGHQALKLWGKLYWRRWNVAAHFNKSQRRSQAHQQLIGVVLLSTSQWPARRSIGRASTGEWRGLHSAPHDRGQRADNNHVNE